MVDVGQSQIQWMARFYSLCRKEGMRKKDGRDMETFGALDSRVKTIAILGDRWWPQTVKQEGDKISKKVSYVD